MLLGITLGTILSHGLAIFLGTSLANFTSNNFTLHLHILTGISFLVLGFFGLIPTHETTSKHSVPKFLTALLTHSSNLSSILSVALLIFIGEFGDKTFVSSICLSSKYPDSKYILLLASTFGMIFSNLLAIFLGRLLKKIVSPSILKVLSSILFILFGIISLFTL